MNSIPDVDGEQVKNMTRIFMDRKSKHHHLKSQKILVANKMSANNAFSILNNTVICNNLNFLIELFFEN